MTRIGRKKSKIIFSPLLKVNSKFFERIKQNGRSHRRIKQIMNDATDQELLSLVEICFNLLKGRIHLSKQQHSLLKKQATVLRKLSRARSSQTARSLLQNSVGQKGDGLPLIPTILASVILPILTESLISKFK